MTTRIEGLSIGLDLDTLRLDRGLTGLKDRLRTVNAEMRKNMSAFDYGDRSIAKYETRLQGLNKKLEIQKAVTKEAKAEYEKMVAEHGEGSKEAEKAAREYNKQAAALNNLERYVDGVSKELAEMREQQRLTETGWGRLGKVFEDTGAKLTAIGDKMKSTGRTMSMYITAPLAGFGTLAAKTGIDFDDSMAQVQAVSGATGKDLIRLRDKAKQMGATTKFSASQSAEALNYMAMAGWKTNDMIDGLDGIMSLAAASGEDLGTVSDIVTDALTAFGLQAKDSGRFADILASASSNANTNVAMMGKSFEYAAPVAGALGFEVEDVAVALGLMANSGIKADKAGTALRTMFTNLAKPSKQMQKAMDKLDISLTDSEGNMKSLDTIMKELRVSFGELDEAQQAQNAAAIFGKEAMSGALAIINASEEDYNKLAKAIRNSEGAAKEMSDIMEGTLGGTIREIKSGLEGFAISIYEHMLPALEFGAEKVKNFVGWLNNLPPSVKMTGVVIGALAAAIGPTLIVFGSFIGLIGKSLSFLAPLMTAIAKAGGLLGYLKAAFLALSGPVGIVIGVIAALTTGIVIAYKKSETFRKLIHSLGETIKNIFVGIGNFIKPGIDAVVNFFSEIKAKIYEFINNEGSQIIEAFRNIGVIFKSIGSIVLTILNVIWTAVKWTFEQIFNIIQFIMPAIEFVIKMVWDSIKNVIVGTLDIIMGAVKIFSGLFTLDFDKMWEGVKQLFIGSIRAIWGLINLSFFGRIIKGVGGFAGLFRGTISKLWTVVKEIFRKSINSVWNFVKNGFTRILNTTKSINTMIKNVLSGIWKGIHTSIRNIVTGLWNSVRNIFTKMKNGVVNLTSNARKGIVNQWNRIKSAVSDLATGMWNSVKKTFTNMVDGAKKLPGRIGRGIKNSAGKAVEGIKSMGNRMLKGFGKPINKMIGGINWVTEKLGVKKKIPKWEVPQYAKGTDGHPGGLAIVGEKGRELIKLPDGRSFISPEGDTLLNLPKGTHVIPNKETEMILKSDIAHYAKGTKGWLSKIGDVWSYVTNPTKILDKILDGIGIGKISGWAKTLASAGWNFVKKLPGQFIKSVFKKAEEDSGAGGKPAFKWPITSPFGYRTHPISGQRKLHGGVDFGAPMGSPIPSTTSGRVSYASYGWNGGFGNLVKVKQGIWEMFYAHLSKILVKAGQSVKKGDIIGLVGSTGASTGPHLHYETRKNGVRVNPMSLKGFATGGLVKSKMLAMLGEDGEEMVIPLSPNRRTDAMKLLALAAKKIGADDGSFVRPNHLSNPETADNHDLKEMISLLVEQNEHLRKSNELLTALLGKDLDLYKLNKKVDEGLNNLGDRRNAALGIK